MAIGIIGASGKTKAYVDYDITIPASAWGADSSVGPSAYTQTVASATIDPTLYIDEGTQFSVKPNMATITEALLQQFTWISCAESVDNGLKFYSVTGKPSFDINVTVRIHY